MYQKEYIIYAKNTDRSIGIHRGGDPPPFRKKLISDTYKTARGNPRVPVKILCNTAIYNGKAAYTENFALSAINHACKTKKLYI